MKNEIRAQGKDANKDQKIANTQNDSHEKDLQRASMKKRERKALEKSFQLAQLSTASMGKFDKKVSKKEPDAPTS